MAQKISSSVPDVKQEHQQKYDAIRQEMQELAKRFRKLQLQLEEERGMLCNKYITNVTFIGFRIESVSRCSKWGGGGGGGGGMTCHKMSCIMILHIFIPLLPVYFYRKTHPGNAKI